MTIASNNKLKTMPRLRCKLPCAEVWLPSMRNLIRLPKTGGLFGSPVSHQRDPERAA